MSIEIIKNVIIPLFGAIILYIVVPYFKKKTTAQERDNIYFWVRLAVQAAEQIFDYKKAGVNKKEYVLGYINDQGFNISKEELDVMIEAAVLEIQKIEEEL